MVPVRSDSARVIAPPPLIVLAAIAAGLILDRLWPLDGLRDLLGLVPRLAIGAALIAGGMLLALSAQRIFRRIGTPVEPWKPSLRLAAAGPYAYTRNPMYVGFVLFAAGLGVALGSLWTLALLIPAALVLHYGVVRREERYLEQKFGDDYRAFKARVPRYLWRM